MPTDFYPLRVLLLTLSGYVSRHQADVTAYLLEENRVLLEQPSGKRLVLTDDQRRRLAAKGKKIGRGRAFGPKREDAHGARFKRRASIRATRARDPALPLRLRVLIAARGAEDGTED